MILLSGNENEPCYECGKPAKYKLDVEDGEKEFTASFCNRCALQIILGELSGFSKYPKIGVNRDE